MRRDGTIPRSDIVCGVQAALREVRRGETGLSLLFRWVWMHKRVKEREREIKKRSTGWLAFLTLSCGTRVTSHALKHTYASSTRIHSCAIHPSISSSLHHLIIPPLFGSCLTGLSQRTAPFQPVAQTSAITECVMLGLHRCACSRVLPHGSSSPQTGLHHFS